MAGSLLDDLDKETVDFRENYDGTLKEPVVLPAKFPNLLVNGSGGIAVGMATNVPPHNLGEVIDACIAHLDNPEITIDDLCQIIPGPDFPTGALILGRAGALAAYHKGRGSIIMRAKVEVEEIRKDREALIVSAIPYQVNKRVLIEKIAELVREKRIEGISDLWDESNREGMRIVIELKRDAVADVVLNQLWRFSDLQTTFGANVIALNGGRPEQLNLKDLIQAFTAFREEVVSRRTKYLLNKARDRAHVLVGLAIAVANIDDVIQLIRRAPSPAVAKEQLMERAWPARDVGPLVELIADPRHGIAPDGTCRLSDEQASAILELRLSRLTALGRDEIGNDLQKIADEIKEYLAILASRARIVNIIKTELSAIKDRVRGAASHRDHRDGGRGRRRGPHPARGCRRHRQPQGLHQARAAVGLSRAAARRQGPLRHVDAGRGFRYADLHHVDAHAGAVLLVARHVLPHEGLAAAGGDAPVARQGSHQPAAAAAGRGHHLDSAAAGGSREMGRAAAHVRDAGRQRAAKLTGRFREY